MMTNQILAAAPPQSLTFRVVAGNKVVSLDDDGDDLRMLDHIDAVAQLFVQSDAVTSAVSSDTWLLATIVSGIVQVSADPVALSAGEYSSAVTITCASGAVYIVPFAASACPVDNIAASPIATPITIHATKGNISTVRSCSSFTLNYQVAMPLGVQFSITYGQVDFNLYSSSGSFPSVKDFPWLSVLGPSFLNLCPLLDSIALKCDIGAASYALDYWLNDPRSPFHGNLNSNPLVKKFALDLTLAAGTYTATIHIDAPFGITSKAVAVSLVVS